MTSLVRDAIDKCIKDKLLGTGTSQLRKIFGTPTFLPPNHSSLGSRIIGLQPLLPVSFDCNLHLVVGE